MITSTGQRLLSIVSMREPSLPFIQLLAAFIDASCIKRLDFRFPSQCLCTSFLPLLFSALKNVLCICESVVPLLEIVLHALELCHLLLHISLLLGRLLYSFPDKFSSTG